MRKESANAISEHRTPRPKRSQDFTSVSASGIVLQTNQHLVPGVGDQLGGNLAIMREREVDRDQQEQIAKQGEKPEQLAQRIAVVELAHPDDGDEEAHADIEQRERKGLGGAAQIAELAALGEKEAVEEHLEHEQDEQDADLDASGCRPMPSARFA